jgi:molecular chaperone DnaK (HSP70)
MFKYKNIFRNNLLKKNLFKSVVFFKKFSHIISVDMGATNTCIATFESGGPRVIENAEGKF